MIARNAANAVTMANRPIQLIVFLTLAMLPAAAALAAPDTVFFPSADGATEIVAYLFKPQTPGLHPAIVMLHGRGGPYSSNVNKGCALVSRTSPSPCNATTLSKRHMMWGAYWAERGYIALLPDSFGPRGKAHGFDRFTHDDPERADVNEKSVRPLDAEGALSWLRSRNDVIGSRIFLQGWSNGGSTALNVMQRQGSNPSGYRAALAFYPGCGPKALLAATLATEMLHAFASETLGFALAAMLALQKLVEMLEVQYALGGCTPRSRTKTSFKPFVSLATRFAAPLSNATTRPSEEIEHAPLLPMP